MKQARTNGERSTPTAVCTYIVDQVDAPPPGRGHWFYYPRSPVLWIWICSKYREIKKKKRKKETRERRDVSLLSQISTLVIYSGTQRLLQISKWRTTAKIIFIFGLPLTMKTERKREEETVICKCISSTISPLEWEDENKIRQRSGC